MELWPGAQKLNLKCRKFLYQETLNQDFTVITDLLLIHEEKTCPSAPYIYVKGIISRNKTPEIKYLFIFEFYRVRLWKYSITRIINPFYLPHTLILVSDLFSLLWLLSYFNIVYICYTCTRSPGSHPLHTHFQILSTWEFANLFTKN